MPLSPFSRLILLSGLLFLAAIRPAAAQVGFFGPQLSVTPSSATAGGMVALAGSRLADGTYEVMLDTGRGSVVLATVSNGTGEFQRVATVPTLGTGDYPLELRVNGVLVDSATLRVLPPLGVSSTTTTPRAGNTLKFSVTGLSEGSFSLLYAGKTAFGPVAVEGGSYSGSLVLPTDRPATLPADVVLEARNTVGKLVPRIGRRTFAVQPADASPLIRIASSTASTTSLTPRTSLRLSGAVAINDAVATGAGVQYFWKGPDGKVVPMGAAMGSVGADGSFDYRMRSPQLGTMSAQQGVGGGRILSVASQGDRNGVRQHTATQLPDTFNSAPDTDAEVSVQFQLTGSDGLRIEGARIVMDDSNLDELYPPNGNGGPVGLDGSQQPGVVSQYDAFPPSDEILGCPAGLDLQYTDATGVARFDFGLDVPNGGMHVDGSGAVPLVYPLPQTDCVGPDINTESCITMDPGAIDVSFHVQAVHTGYGWFSGPATATTEAKIKVQATVNRYTGHIEGAYIVPGLGAQPFSAERNASIRVTLPKLDKQGLALGDPYFPAPAGKAWIQPASSAGAVVFDFEPITDLTPLQTAAIQPATPDPREFRIHYVRGAGKQLDSATLTLYGAAGRNYEITLGKITGNFDCDNTTDVTEVWGTVLNQPVPGQPTMTLSHGFRFPRLVFGQAEYVVGVVKMVDMDGRIGRRALRLHFPALQQRTRNLALVDGVPKPGIVITDSNLHARRLSLPPLEPVAKAEADAPPAEYNVGERDNSAQAHADYEYCIPTSAPYCGQQTQLASSHLQFSRTPDSQPAGSTFGGGEATSNAQASAPDEWTELFNKTIPLFRWYWGVPEVLSAEVFADLAVKAEYLFRAVFKPEDPAASYARTGGRLSISIMIGVDVDVLFGVLVDAGAAITGTLTGQVVATAPVTGNVCLEENLTFRMDFSGWLEIGCPIDFPLDPTCYIPTVEESFNILNEQISNFNACANPSKAGQRLGALLAQAGTSLAAPSAVTGALPPVTRPPAIKPLTARQRRAANRHPALAADAAGHRMLLYVDNLGRLVARESLLRSYGTPHVLSSGWGVRDVAVTFFSTDRAVAVWAESDLRSRAQVTELASHQFLRTATWDGSAWSAPRNLTAPGFGDGGVKLARCVPNPLRLRADCQSNRASVVYQRNTQRTSGGHKHIYLRHFDGTNWSVETRVDQSGDYNLTPALAYLDGDAVVAWVRYDPGSTKLDEVDLRRLALRFMDGSRAEEVLDRLGTRVAQPSLAIEGEKVVLAYTRAAAADAFIGTRQALYLGARDCRTSPCTVSGAAVRDRHGRMLYGERPTLLRREGNELSVVMRGLAFGSLPGAVNPESNLFPDDALGMRLTVGELLEVRTRYGAARAEVLALTNDAGWHAQPAAVFDPLAGEVLAMSVSVPLEAALRKQAAEHGGVGRASKLALDESVGLASVADLPDLAVDTLSSSATRLDPGAVVPLSVKVANRGSAWIVDAEHGATLRIYWDSPQTRGQTVASIALGSLASGASSTHQVLATVPAAFASDERQSLRAEVLVDSPEGELDGSNNAGAIALGGMPVPLGLDALTPPGTRFVNLVWQGSSDARIAGYRIWVDTPQGPLAIGSSFNPGFADISARYGVQRSYRVSTYSARGIESELSAPVSAQPAEALLGEALFRDDFEGVAP